MVRVTAAPARRSTSNRAVRVGLRPTSCRVSADPGRPAAATPRNAEAEGSPGTRSASPPRSAAPPVTVSRPGALRSTSTPKAASARSVWSRVGSGSTTVVVPEARSPASSTALLICALGTSGVCMMPASAPPVTVERRPSALGGGDPRAHRRQRRDHPPHRPARERGVADQPAGERGRGQHAGQQPHRRARVAAVDVAGGWPTTVRRRRESAPAGRRPRLAGHRDAERLEAGQRRQAVGAGGVADRWS